MKTSKNKELYIKICPQCGSIDVKTDFSNPVVWAYGTNAKYKCNSCGNIKSIFPEVLGSKIVDFKKKLKQEIKEGKVKATKEDLVDTSSGFNVGIYELVIIYGVVLLIIPILLYLGGDINILTALIIFAILISLLFWKLSKNRKKN